MRNGYFIKIIKKYQYTNCTNCTNGTNFNDFNKVIISNFWLLFTIYGLRLFFMVKFSSEQALFYPMTGGFMYKNRILAIFFTVL